METVNTLEQIKELPLGTKLYRPGVSNIRWWFYAGINPKSDKCIMLVHSGNIKDMHSEYMKDDWNEPFYLDYNEACMKLIENAKENVESVTRIYLKQS